jgi:hypothetical protein
VTGPGDPGSGSKIPGTGPEDPGAGPRGGDLGTGLQNPRTRPEARAQARAVDKAVLTRLFRARDLLRFQRITELGVLFAQEIFHVRVDPSHGHGTKGHAIFLPVC